MKYNITLTSLAEQDIRHTFIDYNKKLEGLGNDFENEIKLGITYIQERAKAVQVRYGNIRIYFLKRFPIGIHYQLEGREVLIIGVYSMKEDPNKWEVRSFG